MCCGSGTILSFIQRRSSSLRLHNPRTVEVKNSLHSPHSSLPPSFLFLLILFFIFLILLLFLHLFFWFSFSFSLSSFPPLLPSPLLLYSLLTLHPLFSLLLPPSPFSLLTSAVSWQYLPTKYFEIHNVLQICLLFFFFRIIIFPSFWAVG